MATPFLKRLHIAAAACLLGLPAAAAVTRLISFQGRLTNLAGNPITTGSNLVFRLYNVDAGGSALYTESQTVTPDSDGLYSVNIGDLTSLSGLDFGQDLWLSVTVEGELLPGRYRLTPSPYALYASTAPWSGLTGVPAGFADGTDDTTPGASTVGSSQVINDSIVNADVNSAAAIAYSKLNLAGSVVTGDLTAGSVGGTQIIDSTITAADLAADAVTSAKILNGEIVNADISGSAEIAANKINGGAFQNEAYSFPNGVSIGGSTITSSGNLQMPNGATITIGSVTGTLLPSGTMILSIAACPSGFTEYTNARGFYLVGMPSGGTAAGTVGSAMTNLADATHTHTISTTQVTNLTALGGVSAIATVTSPSGTAARSAIAPYIQVRLCTVP